MFELALGRLPLPEEAESARAFLDEVSHGDFKRRNQERIEAEIAKRLERIEHLTSDEEEDEEKEERNDERERMEEEIERLKQSADASDSWQELAHAIFSMKEFIYLM